MCILSYLLYAHPDPGEWNKKRIEKNVDPSDLCQDLC